MDKPRVLISLCLLGVQCRYDGQCKPPLAELALLQARFDLIPICPEQLGGLATPRPPAERRGSPRRNGKRPGRYGCLCPGRPARSCSWPRQFSCRAAILKAKSPACGSGQIYDGSFSRHLVPGWGVAAQLLRESGLLVCDETQIGWLLAQFPDA